MKYKQIVQASFLERPNRFIAYVDLCGKREKVHVKNTGRCRELLLPGATVYLEQSDNPNRSTGYDLIAVEKEIVPVRKPTESPVKETTKAPQPPKRLINMDSQAPNKAACEALKDGTIKLRGMEEPLTVRAEKTVGDSRFDFYAEDEDGNKAFI